METPSFSMPDEMVAEIDSRRPSTVSRSEYVREALTARFEAEDNGTWAVDDHEEVSAPADD